MLSAIRDMKLTVLMLSVFVLCFSHHQVIAAEPAKVLVVHSYHEPQVNHVVPMTKGTQNEYIESPLVKYEEITEGDYVVFTNQDQGHGIAPEDIDKIFEPFYTNKKMGKSGTGLGMAVVWGTMKDHCGYITCESNVGEGTLFTLYFPVVPYTSTKALEGFSVDSIKGSNETILVVDDLPEQREIASEILVELGYKVSTVASGEEAVIFFKQTQYDMLVLDMILGDGIDGLDTYKQIIKMNPDQKAIITSGYSETERIKETLQLGAGQYVKKPYTLEKIGIAVKKELIS